MTWDTPAEALERRRVEQRWVAARHLVRRSVLIVPANVPRFIDRAHLRGADAVMLDLEDSIPTAQKDEARRALAGAVPAVGRGGADVLVRVNKPRELAEDDLDAAIVAGVAAIGFPKAESAGEIRQLDALIAALERRRGLSPGAIALAISIESARGLGRLDEILAASDRVVSIDLGPEDFTRDLDIEPTASGHELLGARHLVVQAARRAGVQALGMAATLANFADLERLRHGILSAREMGFRGSSCIHPDQVGPLNDLFAPPAAAVDRARQVLAVYDEAVERGRASTSLDGQMIDVPVAERARALIERSDAIAAHEERKRAALAALDG